MVLADVIFLKSSTDVGVGHPKIVAARETFNVSCRLILHHDLKIPNDEKKRVNTIKT